MALLISKRKDLSQFTRPGAMVTPFLAIYLGASSIIITGINEQSIFSSAVLALLLGGFGTFLLLLEGDNAQERLTLQRLFWLTFGFRIFVTAVLHQILKQTYGYEQPYWQYGPNGGDEALFYDRAL